MAVEREPRVSTASPATPASLQPEPPAAPRPSRLGSRYPWIVVGLLWFCGFFNYADRQAVYSVFPLLEKEFHLDNEQLGWLSSAFMIVYAAASPFSGYAVDRLSRRTLIGVGLAFWSLVCAATALSRNFGQLVLFRALEGLGEAFYFPASMSVLASYHSARTRSRAMSIHQTSVYLGTAGGAVLAGTMANNFGWRSPFWALGLAGIAYALFLWTVLREPPKNADEPTIAPAPGDHPKPAPIDSEPIESGQMGFKIARIVGCPPALLLLCTFVGANFVATTFLAWLPKFIYDSFQFDLAKSSIISTAWPLASLVGALGGGVAADWASRRSPGGRIMVQSVGLLVAAPFVFLVGWSPSLTVVIVALIGAGLCKGVYDANIFAALYDVVPAADRGTAAGLMNTVGWTGGFIAPVAVGTASKYFGMGGVIASTALVYVVVSLLAAIACRLAITGARALALESPVTEIHPQ